MLKAEAELEGVMDCLQEVEMGTQQPNTASRTMPLSLLDGGEQPKKDVAPFLVKLLLPCRSDAVNQQVCFPAVAVIAIMFSTWPNTDFHFRWTI